MCRAFNPIGGGWSCLAVRGPAWLQRISKVQSLAIQSSACCFCQRLRPNSPLYSPATLGQVPQCLEHATFCSSCTVGFSGNKWRFCISFFVDRATKCTITGSLPTLTSVPIKNFYVAPTLQSVSYTHLTLPTTGSLCRSRWSPYH